MGEQKRRNLSSSKQAVGRTARTNPRSAYFFYHGATLLRKLFWGVQISGQKVYKTRDQGEKPAL